MEVSMETKDILDDDRQMYQKPQMTVIELSADEVLAIGCKTTSGKASGSNVPPCQIRNCARQGS